VVFTVPVESSGTGSCSRIARLSMSPRNSPWECCRSQSTPSFQIADHSGSDRVTSDARYDSGRAGRPTWINLCRLCRAIRNILWQLAGSAGPDHSRQWQTHRLHELKLAAGTVVSQLRLAVAVAEAKEVSGVQRIFRPSRIRYGVRPDEARRDFQRGSSS
jgi:hypothetical protein